MKTINRIAISFAALLLFTNMSFSQENQRPEYVTVTTMHWDMDQDDFNLEDWKATENEYMDKVTKKNEYIVGASFYFHRFTESNSELLYVQAFKNWADIENAQKRNGELEKEGWADEDARNAYFKKRNSYYQLNHSDEIYATMPGAKLIAAEPTKDLVLYVQKSHFADYADGSDEEFMKHHLAWTKNVIANNDLILGYYPQVHAWGSDKTEFVEAYLLDSLADLDKMFEKNNELYEANISEDERKEMNDKHGKYFTGEHGDYIYTLVHDVGK